MITCYLEYKIDMYKVKEFRAYAEMWIPLVEKYGGVHHGYFLPKESASDLAVALFSFDSLAAYEEYRTASRQDPECKKASAYSSQTKCILGYKRQFLEPILSSKTEPPK
jgi:hypothetical protein